MKLIHEFRMAPRVKPGSGGDEDVVVIRHHDPCAELVSFVDEMLEGVAHYLCGARFFQAAFAEALIEPFLQRHAEAAVVFGQ